MSRNLSYIIIFIDQPHRRTVTYVPLLAIQLKQKNRRSGFSYLFSSLFSLLSSLFSLHFPPSPTDEIKIIIFVFRNTKKAPFFKGAFIVLFLITSW